MAVRLNLVDTNDPTLRTIQQNVSDAIDAIQEARTPIGVLPVSGNTKLVGNEDVVLVDAGTANATVTIVLPPVKMANRIVSIKITKQGSFQVVVKSVDIPQATSPTIDGGFSITVPTGGVRIASDGRNFWTVP